MIIEEKITICYIILLGSNNMKMYYWIIIINQVLKYNSQKILTS